MRRSNSRDGAAHCLSRRERHRRILQLGCACSVPTSFHSCLPRINEYVARPTVPTRIVILNFRRLKVAATAFTSPRSRVSIARSVFASPTPRLPSTNPSLTNSLCIALFYRYFEAVESGCLAYLFAVFLRHKILFGKIHRGVVRPAAMVSCSSLRHSCTRRMSACIVLVAQLRRQRGVERDVSFVEESSITSFTFTSSAMSWRR